jgi:DNA-binding response OmpR family regulator
LTLSDTAATANGTALVRILVVEDDEDIVSFVERGLQEAGHAVDVTGDGDDALNWTLIVEYDAIILDVMLPSRDGYEVARELRSRGKRTPILMLTARDSIDDRVIGLDSGADDYLVKPFAFAELLARLRALDRRQPLVHHTTLTIADLELDTTTYEVRRALTPITLTNKEYMLLELFMRHPNQVLTREMIANRLWNYEFDNFSNVIDVYVRYLRKKIDDPFDRKLIQTVRGVGYRIVTEPD